MSGLLSNLLKFTGQTIRSAVTSPQFHVPTVCALQNRFIAPAITSVWSSVPVRTIIKDNFPKAKEGKRIKTLGWRTKLKTKNGRRLIMRRILKGRFYLTH